VRAKKNAYVDVGGAGLISDAEIVVVNVPADMRPCRVGWETSSIDCSVECPPYTDGRHGADGGWEKGKDDVGRVCSLQTGMLTSVSSQIHP